MPWTDGPVLSVLLRAWRERALLTQEQLASRANLNVRTIRRLEAGELQRPRGASIRLLAAALGLDEAELAILVGAVNTAPPLSPSARITPRQLPVDVPEFVGRVEELALLDEARAGDGAAAVVITAIDGMAGVGKTALAVHAAHQLASRFPDGNLFVDLHGHTQGMAAADPADMLGRVLGTLGVPGESIPQHADDRAALYRSLLAGRRMLIVLDNATDEAQVRPLLPGAGRCLVLVTSRRRLVGLDGALTVSVDVLPLADAVALFTATAGEERVAGEPRGVLEEVVRRCGMLPLAIRVAAARLKAHPSWTAGHLLERFEQHRRRLSELQAGERSVTGALDLSYRELAPSDQRAYRLLSLPAGVDIAPDAAAALLATTTEQAERVLEGLLEVHLLQEPSPGRYRFHDLIRVHARERADDEEAELDRRAALSRLLDHYREATSAVMDRLYPYESDLRRHPATGTFSLPGATAATAWLDAELTNLLALAQHAAEHDFPEHVQHLSTSLHWCLRSRGRWAEAETLHTWALSAARATADLRGEMDALIARGAIHHRYGRHQAAIEDTKGGLDIARAIQHRSGELRALNVLGMIHGLQGRFAQAGDYAAQALRIARAIGHRAGQVEALISSGKVHRIMGEHKQAVDDLTQAITIAQAMDDRTGTLRALNSLGRIYLGQGEHDLATGSFTRALDLARGTGHRVGELDSLTGLGYLHRIHGRHHQAQECYQQALIRAHEVGDRNWQFEAIHGMGRLHHQCGRADQALDDHHQALHLASDLDQPSDQARAHDGLAHAHSALNQCDKARHHWAQALAILTSLGIDRTEESGVDVTSIRLHLGDAVLTNARSTITDGSRT
ncbi:tetratricopeptide repeat protein [Nonomuraea sp. NPDC049709]|uniref:ATP-binding protein n=1 Tax=Nonomuraea sp. NPDC049709 TaxID=3154736 RepID=UPI0034266BEA